jgi:hypothetical protein
MAFGSGPPATARTAPPLPNPAMVGGMNPPQGASPAIAHLLAGLAAQHGAPVSLTAHPPAFAPHPGAGPMPMGPRPGGMPMVHPGAAPLPQSPIPGAGPPAMPMMAPGSAAPGVPPGGPPGGPPAGPPRPAMVAPRTPVPAARAPFPAKKGPAKGPPPRRPGLRTERV